MGYRKKLRIVLGILKDKGTLIKTTLSPKRQKSSIRRVILRATTHGSTAPPSGHRIAAAISLGHGSRATACACIQALMDRLHHTSSASVALKCLYIIHNIIGKGSFILKDQLSIYPCFGGRNFLNLSMFRDDSDSETWEISTWVRWYAGILEQNLMVSRILGYHLYSSRAKNDSSKKDKILAFSNSDLLKEIDFLVDFADQVGNAPNSLYLQRKILVHEVVRLVSEDYRLVQREMSLRVAELGLRMMSLSFSDCTQFLNSLNRFEDCKERTCSLLVNRNRNDDLWDSMKETKAKVSVMMMEKKEGKMFPLLTEFSQLFPLVGF
ncbi:putative clathrin assembly protein At4g40080 [Durio zibethinus]|uniref:Clathrin assembly protein At4g40080 n=1 Tax=Durio zibethinus TaxID=66656 RepID=A0A6P6B530_DURZI|nr:putative clathrin assembly protein At4g40080 [Durio zibethinus]